MTDKRSRNEDEYFAKRDAELIKTTREQRTAQKVSAEHLLHYMKCPKDGYDLSPVDQHGIEVDVCSHCGGVWLDAGELREMVRLGSTGLFKRLLSDLSATLGKRPGTQKGKK
jgi:hypothetical protein